MSPSRHILVTANMSWNILNFRAGIIRALVARGDRVSVLAPVDESVPAIEALGCRHIPLDMNPRGRSASSEAALILRLWRILQRERPDAVLSYTIKNNLYGGLATRRLGIPFMPNVTGLGTVFTEGGTLLAFIRRLYRVAFQSAEPVFFQNPSDRQHFLEAGIVTAEKSKLLPGSGVDLSRFSARPLPGDPERPVFLMVARLLKEKGVAQYAEAALQVQKTCPGARFLIAGGHDPADSACVSASDLARWQAEGALEHIGRVGDIRVTLAEADVCVLPSYYAEGTPRSLLEAAASGRPILTTDLPGCRDTLVPGESGLLCRPRDAGDLAANLSRLIDLGPEARARMGAASRKLAETRFDERLVIDAYLHAIDRATGRVLADAHAL
ncbi:MAG: glycosyltransferase family 4 protein [Pseudomonadota bacterium]